MRWAVIGAAGQLGTDVVAQMADLAWPLGHEAIELTDHNSVSGVLGSTPLAGVINCAAYNLVDQAEDEPAIAYGVNALGPRNLALVCQQRGLPLIHISTDYVFGAEGPRVEPYLETDRTGPTSAYGVSKLAGEYFVQTLCPQSFVVRTCGLYGLKAARGKGNFIETMLRLAATRDELRVVGDSRCTPTCTDDLARWIVALTRSDRYGVYHATQDGDCSWAELATEIFRLSGLPTRVIPVPATEYPTKARRPAYSVLCGTKLNAVLQGQGLASRADWREALAAHLNRRSGTQNGVSSLVVPPSGGPH